MREITKSPYLGLPAKWLKEVPVEGKKTRKKKSKKEAK